MKKVENKKVESKNNEFYKLIGNRAKVIGESKESVLFANAFKDKNETKYNYTWLPKSLVFKNDYWLGLNISIPKNWELKFWNTDNENFVTDKIDEFCNAMGFRLKDSKKE